MQSLVSDGLSKTEYAYTTGSLGTAVRTIPYGYGDASWSDLLTSIGGQSLTADEIGNLLSDGTWAYTWQHGRQLAGMSKSGQTIAYGYDPDGKRITKTVNGTAYNYHYLDDQLVELTWGGNKLHFTYDSTGPLSVNYNGTEYFYVKNAQGDVTGLISTSGARVVTYTYDAWGNPLTTTGSMAATLGAQNPLRYRGYVYDTETGLYYLQSRYYNPGWGRFINADGYASTGQGIIGNNMFAYCGNNPVKHLDPQGTFFKEIGVFFKRVLSNLKRNFTMKANVSRVYNRKTIYFGGLITVERGTTVKTTTSPNRKMQKQPTIYSDVDRSDPSDSSVGITIPRMNSEFDIHLGVSDTGITHSYNMGETVMGSGCRVDFKDFRTGLFFSTTRANGSYITTTDYIYISMDGEAAIAVLVFIGSGQWIPGKMPLQPSVLG